MMKIEKGDIVTCPECDLELMECLEPPKLGSSEYAKNFKYLAFDGSPGALATCPACGKDFVLQNRNGAIIGIWVKEKGWVI